MIGSRPAIEENLRRIRSGLATACERRGRDRRAVRVVAVAKGIRPEVVRWAVEAGAVEVGENDVRELREKRERVPGATWHYVGILQSHTAHRVADLADVVHTLVPGKAAERLSGRAERSGRRLPALIQVDFTGRRAGLAPEEVEAFATRAAGLVGLELRGLMTLPPMPRDPEDSRPFFRRLAELRGRVAASVEGFEELSMGMSVDYAVAAEEGATMVRIGTALFGDRPVHEGT